MNGVTLTLCHLTVLFMSRICLSEDVFYFINRTETVVGIDKQNVELKCMISIKLDMKDYGNVTWMKVPRRILTRGVFRVTPDLRYRLKFQNILNTNKFNLLIEPAKANDEGEYRCSFVRKNEILFKIVVLNILVPPEIMKVPKPEIFVKQNDLFKLTCNASGRPDPKIVWYSLESNSEDSKRIPILYALKNYEFQKLSEIYAVGPTLYISNVHRNMTGHYMCLASNGVDPDDMFRFKLTVKFEPEVTMTNSEIHQRLGGDTVIECLVLASPMGIIQWMHNDQGITPMLCSPLESRGLKYCLVENRNERQSELVPVSVKLTIFNLEYSDYGDYECKVQTTMGVGSGVTKLKLTDFNRPSVFNKQIYVDEIIPSHIKLLPEKTNPATQISPVLQYQKYDPGTFGGFQKNGSESTFQSIIKNVIVMFLYLMFYGKFYLRL